MSLGFLLALKCPSIMTKTIPNLMVHGHRSPAHRLVLFCIEINEYEDSPSASRGLHYENKPLGKQKR